MSLLFAHTRAHSACMRLNDWNLKIDHACDVFAVIITIIEIITVVDVGVVIHNIIIIIRLDLSMA